MVCSRPFALLFTLVINYRLPSLGDNQVFSPVVTDETVDRDPNIGPHPVPLPDGQPRL